MEEKVSLFIRFAGKNGEKISYHLKNTKKGIISDNLLKKTFSNNSTLKKSIAKQTQKASEAAKLHAMATPQH